MYRAVEANTKENVWVTQKLLPKIALTFVCSDGETIHMFYLTREA